MSDGDRQQLAPPAAARIAAWSSALAFDALPAAVVAAAKRAILDTMGVSLAAGPTELVRRVYEHARDVYAPGPARVPGLPGALSPVGASLVNGTAAHALDFDDTSYTGIMHGSAVVLPAALAASDTAGGDGRRLIEAFVAGSEVAYAIALACGTGHYRAGWWSTSTFGMFGAAAAAARALGLDAAQSAVAIALAGMRASGQKSIFGTDAKPLAAGLAAAAGVEAAMLARRGVGGPLAVLEGRNGFLQLCNAGRFDPAAIDRLGQAWRLVEPGLFFKQYPVCSGAHAAAELTRRLLREHGVAARDVRRVVCEVPPVVAMSLVYDRPATPQEAQFSLPFAVGAMLARGELAIDSLSTEVLGDARMRAAMAKVEMRRVDSMHSDRAPEGARVTVVTNGGAEFRGQLDEPTGMPARPLTDADLRAKFMRCAAAGGVEPRRAEALLAHVAALEEAPVAFAPFQDLGR